MPKVYASRQLAAKMQRARKAKVVKLRPSYAPEIAVVTQHEKAAREAKDAALKHDDDLVLRSFIHQVKDAHGHAVGAILTGYADSWGAPQVFVMSMAQLRAVAHIIEKRL
jgi:hypothetical protein